MADISFPSFAKDRGPGYWLRIGNLAAARRKILRPDYSNQWRYTFGESESPDLSTPFSKLLEPDRLRPEGFRFIILGDTGEGDASQYGLTPLLRALKPDFMIIDGDIAYPAGRINEQEEKDDYICGMFKPYHDFDCPIWAVPGNHEYYAEGRGREFYDIFCTRTYEKRWESNGLRLIPQPAMYWELKEPERTRDLVVIGIDTGQAANLDGNTRKWWEIWKRSHSRDVKQYNWLIDRLKKAQKADHSVIILFHIPGLVREKHDDKTRLKTLHQIMGSFSCVKLVVCGHEHNYQHYAPSVFERYLKEIHQCQMSNPDLKYIVSGGGGAYLTTTAFKSGRFPSHFLYPKQDQWHEYARVGRKIVDNLKIGKSVIARGVSLFEDAALEDADQLRYLSFLLIDVDWKGQETITTVTPIFLNDIQQLFKNLPDETKIEINDPDIRIDPQAVLACFQNGNNGTENLSFRI